MKYYGPRHTYEYTVRATNCAPFETDSLKEAVQDALAKARFCNIVVILDDDELIAKWRNGNRVFTAKK